MNNQKISTKLGTIVLIIIAITVGVFVQKVENSQPQQMATQPQKTINVKKPTVSQQPQINQANHYSNSDYGFSLDLPNTSDSYVIQVSPGMVTKISFLLPVTNPLYTKQTGQTWADVFNIFVYPKAKIAELQQECYQNPPGYDLFYKCAFEGEKSIAENDTYSFYYHGGQMGMTAYPQAFGSDEIGKSKNASTTIKSFAPSLNYDGNAWHTFSDLRNGYEIQYPNDWVASPALPSASSRNTYVGNVRGPVGEMVFDNWYVHDPLLANSVEGNLKLINSKTNLTGPKSSFKEIQITGGIAFYSPTPTSISSSERQFFIIGNKDVLNGTFQVSSANLDAQQLAQFIAILSQFKFFH